jgi:hypothetical protein
MSWHVFWEAGERYADRFYTVSVTLTVLKVCGYMQIGWTPIFVCIGVAFVLGVTLGTIAAVTKGSQSETGSDHV